MSKAAKIICVILLLGCAALWFLAPYITLISDHTAFNLVSEAAKAKTLFKIDGAEDFLSLCAVLGTIVGVVICLIGSLAGARIFTGLVGIITEIPLVIYFVRVYTELSKYVGSSEIFKNITKLFGVGYWGIIILMLVVIITAFFLVFCRIWITSSSWATVVVSTSSTGRKRSRVASKRLA